MPITRNPTRKQHPTMPKRPLLVINPNTSIATTERLSQVLSAMPHDAELVFKTAAFGASYITCEASHAVAAHAALDVWAKHVSQQPEPLAGVLIACFGEPGLFALRESSACPVTGLAEASFIEAAQHGEFAIVTGGECWRPMLQRLALSLGFAPLLKHIEIVQPTGAQLLADPATALQCLGQACQAASLPGVKSIILGGAGLAGYAQLLQASCPVPLIDSASAGLRVLLGNLAPAAQRETNGFVAKWSGVGCEMLDLKTRT